MSGHVGNMTRSHVHQIMVDLFYHDTSIDDGHHFVVAVIIAESFIIRRHVAFIYFSLVIGRTHHKEYSILVIIFKCIYKLVYKKLVLK